MNKAAEFVGGVSLAIAPMALLAACTPNNEPPARRAVAEQRLPEEARIRQVLAAYAAARQRGDGRAQAAYYSEDAEFWHPRSGDPLERGRARMETFLAADPEPFRLEPVNISFAARDVALVDAHFFGTGPSPNGVAYYVMVKRSGEWLIRAVRIIPLPLPKPS